MVVVPPGRWPVTAQADAAVDAAIGFERGAPPAQALKVYESGLVRWPASLPLAIGVFVVAWIGQFIGHKIEGRKPSFLTDLSYLLVGPLWTLDKLYRKLGWPH